MDLSASAYPYPNREDYKNKFTLYLAGNLPLVTDDKVNIPLKNKLLSYAEIPFRNEILGNIKGNLMIDSGAFSVFTRGVEVNIDEYCDFCLQSREEFEKLGRNVVFVSLDVIPNIAGVSNKNTKKEKIDDSCKRGIDNLIYMKKKGIQPVHVLHCYEDYELISVIAKETDYLGLSPNARPSLSLKEKFLNDAFEYIKKNKIDIMTHGFGVGRLKFLKNYPFTSTDSTGWFRTGAFGGIKYPIMGYTDNVFSDDIDEKEFRDVHLTKMKNSPPSVVKYWRELLTRDGYDFDEVSSDYMKRHRVNVRYSYKIEEIVNRRRLLDKNNNSKNDFYLV